MNRTLFLAGTAVLSCAFVAGAHGQQSHRAASTTATPGQRVVVTGCVERLSDTRGRAADRVKGAENSQAPLVLTHVMPVRSAESADRAPNAAVGTTGTTAGAAVGLRTYRIADNAREHVLQHVGQKVEVRGTLEPQAGTPTRQHAADPESTTEPPAPVIAVDSVKVLLASCSE